MVFGSLLLLGQNREFSTYPNDIQKTTTKGGREMRAKGEEENTNHDGGRPNEHDEGKEKKNRINDWN